MISSAPSSCSSTVWLSALFSAASSARLWAGLLPCCASRGRPKGRRKQMKCCRFPIRIISPRKSADLGRGPEGPTQQRRHLGATDVTAPQKDRFDSGPDPGFIGKAWQPPGPPASGHSCRGHQWKRIAYRFYAGDPRGSRLQGALLHLAASSAI